MYIMLCNFLSLFHSLASHQIRDDCNWNTKVLKTWKSQLEFKIVSRHNNNSKWEKKIALFTLDFIEDRMYAKKKSEDYVRRTCAYWLKDEWFISIIKQWFSLTFAATDIVVRTIVFQSVWCCRCRRQSLILWTVNEKFYILFQHRNYRNH